MFVSVFSSVLVAEVAEADPVVLQVDDGVVVAESVADPLVLQLDEGVHCVGNGTEAWELVDSDFDSAAPDPNVVDAEPEP